MQWRALCGCCVLLLLHGYATAEKAEKGSPADDDRDHDDTLILTSSSRSSPSADIASGTRAGVLNPTPQKITHNPSATLSRPFNHTFTPGATHAPPFTPHTHAPPPSPSAVQSQSTQRHGPSAVAIVFGVVGGLFALAVVASIVRCVYKYKRTPGRDRIAALLDRHRLERELAEMEEAPPARRRSLLGPPPPPYQRPPDYGEEISREAR